MSITDELRSWAARELASWKMARERFDALTGIADRIDAEHEAKVSYWQGASYKDGYDEGFASADDWLGQHEDAMAEHGWVRLPVDADGVPWRLGDELMMEGDVCEVVGIGSKTIFYAFGDGIEWTIAHNNRHHKPPTVEDVLRQVIACANNGTYIHGALDTEQIIAEYAAKLQLRENA